MPSAAQPFTGAAWAISEVPRFMLVLTGIPAALRARAYIWPNISSSVKFFELMTIGRFSPEPDEEPDEGVEFPLVPESQADSNALRASIAVTASTLIFMNSSSRSQ